MPRADIFHDFGSGASSFVGELQNVAHDRFLLNDLMGRLFPLRQGYGGQGPKKLLALIPAFSPRRRGRRNLSCALQNPD